MLLDWGIPLKMPNGFKVVTVIEEFSVLIHRLHSRLFLKIDLYDIGTICLWKSTSLSSIQLQTTVELKRFSLQKIDHDILEGFGSVV